MNSSSHPKNGARTSSPAIEKVRSFFADAQQTLPLKSENSSAPGSMNDAAVVRLIIAESMRACGETRATIADRMSLLTGTTVTESMLNNFAAESRSDVRFPAELIRAFCAAVGDNQLMLCIAQLAGLSLLDSTGVDLMELGRQYLRERDAAERKASLEARLRKGVDLG